MSNPEHADFAVKRYKLEQLRNGAASWFAWIAALSLLNTIFFVAGSDVSFGFGLGTTQIVDWIFSEAPRSWQPVGFLINIAIAGVFVLFWHLAKVYWLAFFAGAILYGFDALVFVAAGLWFGVAFHAFVILLLFGGYRAARKLETELEGVTSAEPVVPASA